MALTEVEELLALIGQYEDFGDAEDPISFDYLIWGFGSDVSLTEDRGLRRTQSMFRLREQELASGSSEKNRRWIHNGKTRVSQGLKQIQNLACGQSDRLTKVAATDEATAIAALADIFSQGFFGFPPFTLSQLLFKIGLKRFCSLTLEEALKSLLEEQDTPRSAEHAKNLQDNPLVRKSWKLYWDARYQRMGGRKRDSDT